MASSTRPSAGGIGARRRQDLARNKTPIIPSRGRGGREGGQRTANSKQPGVTSSRPGAAKWQAVRRHRARRPGTAPCAPSRPGRRTRRCRARRTTPTAGRRDRRPRCGRAATTSGISVPSTGAPRPRRRECAATSGSSSRPCITRWKTQRAVGVEAREGRRAGQEHEPVAAVGIGQRDAGVQRQVQLAVVFVAGRAQPADGAHRRAGQPVLGHQAAGFGLADEHRPAGVLQRADAAQRQAAERHPRGRPAGQDEAAQPPSLARRRTAAARGRWARRRRRTCRRRPASNAVGSMTRPASPPMATSLRLVVPAASTP